LARLDDEPSQVNLFGSNWIFWPVLSRPSIAMLRAKVPNVVPSLGATL
jgi:hypothetical protein